MMNLGSHLIWEGWGEAGKEGRHINITMTIKLIECFSTV